MIGAGEKFLSKLRPEMAELLAELESGNNRPVAIDPKNMVAARSEFVRLNERWNTPMPTGVSVRQMDLMERDRVIPLRIFTSTKKTLGSIIFVHGGGFIFGSPETHARFAALLAKGTGLSVVSVDYRLAPEHPFPYPLEDLVAVLERRSEIWRFMDIENGSCVLVGDSAGATLALGALLSRPDLANDIDAAALCYGAFGLNFATPSYVTFSEGYRLTRERMIEFWSYYLPKESMRRRPEAVPLLADSASLSALPPLFINAAGIDPLLSDSVLLHSRVAELGRNDILDIEDGVIHGYLQMSHHLAPAEKAIQRLTQWLARKASPDKTGTTTHD